MSYTGQYVVTINGTNWSSYVINASLTVGRQKLTDRWVPDTAEIELLAPASGGPTIPSLGQEFYYDYGTIPNSFRGVIVDIERNYGIPYNSGTGAAPADRIRIRAESYQTNQAARAIATGVTISTNANLSIAISDVWFAAIDSLSAPAITGGGGGFIAQAETYTGNVLDYINSCMISCVGYAWTGSGILDLASNGVRQQYNYINFTDTGSQSSVTHTYFYDQIQFLGSVDNSYTRVFVGYNNGGSTTTSSTGTIPYTAYQTTSNLKNLSDAQQTADVMESILSQSTYRPFRLSTRASIVGSFDLAAQLKNNPVGTAVSVTFRGTTYPMICEGYTASQDVDDAVWTFYFSPALNLPLILDSTTFGILNTNTLGLG